MNCQPIRAIVLIGDAFPSGRRRTWHRHVPRRRPGIDAVKPPRMARGSSDRHRDGLCPDRIGEWRVSCGWPKGRLAGIRGSGIRPHPEHLTRNTSHGTTGPKPGRSRPFRASCLRIGLRGPVHAGSTTIRSERSSGRPFSIGLPMK